MMELLVSEVSHYPKKLTPSERSKIAKEAAKARWLKTMKNRNLVTVKQSGRRKHMRTNRR